MAGEADSKQAQKAARRAGAGATRGRSKARPVRLGRFAAVAAVALGVSQCVLVGSYDFDDYVEGEAGGVGGGGVEASDDRGGAATGGEGGAGASGGSTGGNGTSGSAGSVGDASQDAGDAGGSGVVRPSCVGLESACGPSEDASCCATAVVPTGTFERVNDPTRPATVSAFELDLYEVTVGRFRKFVDAYPASLPPSGAGAHPAIAISGWDGFAWNGVVPATADALRAQLTCQAAFGTWTDTAADNETKPINCVTWQLAFAFCAWDGARLPTEAEWNAAASGGSEQRVYPWGDQPPDASRAVFDCVSDGSASQSCAYTDILNVGSRPSGNARWGHSDIGGSVSEWTLDWYGGLPIPCSDCADLFNAAGRVVRGGSYESNDFGIRTFQRESFSTQTSSASIGFRCARPAVSTDGETDAGADGSSQDGDGLDTSNGTDVTDATDAIDAIDATEEADAFDEIDATDAQPVDGADEDVTDAEPDVADATTDPAVDVDGAPLDAAAPCSLGLTACGGACVDLQNDEANCGNCGTDCQGKSCIVGLCGNVVFVTNKTFTGNLGGVAGGDSTCQSFASSAGLFGIYKAWLSAGLEGLAKTATERLTHSNKPYLLRDGTLVATNWSDLVDGALAHAIFMNPEGGPAASGNASNGCSPGAIPYPVWTGTNSSGSVVFAADCGEWFGSGALGVLGNARSTAPTWTQYCSATDCTQKAALYCLQQ